jgi:hypothetical protein
LRSCPRLRYVSAPLTSFSSLALSSPSAYKMVELVWICTSNDPLTPPGNISFVAPRAVSHDTDLAKVLGLSWPDSYADPHANNGGVQTTMRTGASVRTEETTRDCQAMCFTLI